MTISAIARRRLSDAISADEDDDFLSLAEKLSPRGVGLLVVLNAVGGLAGVVSERGLVAPLARHGAGALAHAARDMMTGTVLVCSPQDREAEVMLRMLEKGVRHVPVVQDGKVLGMVSLGDAVRQRLIEIGKLLEGDGSKSFAENPPGAFSRHLNTSKQPKIAGST